MDLIMWRKERILIAIFSVFFVCLHHSTQINGDHYECIQASQQPAFKHPLLRDHQIEWQPTILPREVKRRGLLDEFKPKNSVATNTICPPYSIPIRKPPRKPESVSPNSADNSIYRFSRLQLVHYDDDKFRGAHAFISVDNPKCESGQASGAAIWLESDGSNQKTAIKVGWMVDPDTFGDPFPHLTITWTADGYHTTGCNDLVCPGFIQVSNDILLGARFSGISVLGGDQYDEYFYIFQDKATLNWWLVCSQAGYNRFVGYWPKEIVPGLNGGATKLYFGGSTVAHIGKPFPPMGFGQFPTGDRKYSIFFRQLQYVNISNYLIEPYPYGTKFDSANPNCYLTRYDDDGGHYMGHSIYVGGPGGSC